MNSQRANRFFSIFRYMLVIYVVIFSWLFVTLIPSVFGFRVSVVEQAQEGSADIPTGAIIISKPLEEGGNFFRKFAVKENNIVNEKQDDEREIPFVVETKLNSQEIKQGEYLYYIPFVGYIVEPLKQSVIPLFMLFIFLYFFTYRIQQPKS